MARGVASVSDSPLMSARHGLNMLLALYESEPETVTIAEDAPTLPFLFRSSSCGDKASMWDGVGTNNILVALRYACLSVATAYYTAAMKVKTHKELLTNLKNSAKFLYMASKFAPSPQGVTETPFEMMGGLDFIRYSYEVLMYGVFRPQLETSPSALVLRELKRLSFMHTTLMSISKSVRVDDAKMTKWCDGEIQR